MNAQSGYRWFSSPLALAFGDDGSIFVSDRNYGVFSFGADRKLRGILTDPDRPNAAVYGDINLVGGVLAGLADGKLFLLYAPDPQGWTVDDPGNIRGNDYIALAADPSGTLYALTPTGEIDRVSVSRSPAASTISIAADGPQIVPRTADPALSRLTSVRSANGGLALAGDDGRHGLIALYDIQNSAVVSAIGKATPYIAPVRHIAAGTENDIHYVIAAHANGEIVKYDWATGKILARTNRADARLSSPTRVSARGGSVYVSDSDTLAVNEYALEDLSYKGALFYSKGSDIGRLDNPGGLAVWGGEQIVADTGNRRVQIWKRDGTAAAFSGAGADTFVAPYDAAADAEGNIYVADNRTDLYKFDRNFELQYKLPLGRVSVTAIAATPDGRLFAADKLNNRVWTVAKNEADEYAATEYGAFVALAEPIALAASHRLPAVFCLTADGGTGASVYILRDGTSAPVTDGGAPLAVPGAKHIAVDAEDNLLIYADPSGRPSVLKFAPVQNTPAGVLAGEYAAAGSDNLAYDDGLTASVAGLTCDPITGAPYLSDSGRSAVSGVKAYNKTNPLPDPYTHPVDYAVKTAVSSIETARLTRDAAALSVPYGSKPDADFKKDAPAIVLKRDLTDDANCYNSYFSYVFLPETGQAGYVLKSALGEAAQNVRPAFTDGRIYTENAPVYKYPSKNAPELVRFPKNKQVKLLSAPVFQSGADKWYCIELENGIGFIDVLNVSNGKYRPTDGTLATDAAISRSGAGGATLYERSAAGGYEPLADNGGVVTLPNGARVKVSGVFDPNSEYTPVTYQDSRFGMIDGYVRTRYIKYDSVSRFQLIMLGALIVLLAAAVVCFVVVRKKRLRSVV
ncbi:hypothetical protein FACS1894211_07740 [Clostridia bacterium]|nr:hypothetical protein FACS1894211_07740 [Clostridia bacterium]